jgi:hypothetical protein
MNRSSRFARLFAIATGALMVLSADAARAQTASFRGRVLTDSTERPIEGVVVSIPELRLATTSDSLGNFFIPKISPGAHLVTVRKIGYSPVTSRVVFVDTEFETVLVLTRMAAQALPDVKVETKAVMHGRLAEFEERRLAGAGGRFLTKDQIEKHAYGNLSDILKQLPGIEFRQNPGLSNEVYAVGGRNSVPGGSLARGGGAMKGPPSCLAAVVLDGAFVYAGATGEQPFNLNSINPTDIAGVEYYAGASSMPIKYNSMRNTCGLLMIWTK